MRRRECWASPQEDGWAKREGKTLFLERKPYFWNVQNDWTTARGYAQCMQRSHLSWPSFAAMQSVNALHALIFRTRPVIDPSLMPDQLIYHSQHYLRFPNRNAGCASLQELLCVTS